MITLSTPIRQVPGVGPALAKAFHRLDITTVRELLLHFPRRYVDLSTFRNIKDIKAGETVTIRVVVKTIRARPSFRGRVSVCEAVVSDATGSIKITWFNQPYLAKQIHSGDEMVFSGKAVYYKTLQLQNPIHEKAAADTTHTGRIIPVYNLTEGLYNRTLQKLIKLCLNAVDGFGEIIPPFIVERFQLPALPQAVQSLHFPDSLPQSDHARQRIIFEEALIQQLAVRQHALALQHASAPKIPGDVAFVKTFLKTLPFQLTSGQKRSLWQIMQDMESARPMNRLLEGDVGSGKTLVALMAMISVVRAGYQTILLAPTEILARQHYEAYRRQLEKNPALSLPVNIGLLTGQFHEINGRSISREHVAGAARDGEIDIMIGTHALLQDTVGFKNLGLVVIDEQHRFGVEQRGILLKKRTPHLLSMSATPIPRTLALAFYGNLSISTLDELPKGRQKIITRVISEDQRPDAYEFIKKQLHAGRQIFIITPRVEETENQQIRSVKKEYGRLSREIFPEFRLGLLYGKMKSIDKDRAMEKFHKGSLDILVATSVIEIGIDIPNATVMLIEGAERFGLAQLHQLRGRVGRGSHQSYCLLFPTAEQSESKERLELFARSHSGFELAELDLKQRGFGSLFGTEQTGFDFRFPQFLTLPVLRMAREAALMITDKNKTLADFPELKKRVDPLVKKIHFE